MMALLNLLPAMSVVVGSITEPLMDFATGVVDDLGLWGIFILMVPESALIPIPSEATMLFAGFSVYKGTYTMLEAVMVGSIANVVGSWIAYGLGYFGRLDLIEKHGKKLHISPKHLKMTDDWFQKHGAATVFWARMLPIVRTFISLPAGVAKMNFWKFTLYTFLGCIPWMFMLTFIGKTAGENWEDWKVHLHWIDYAVATIIVVGAAYFGIRWLRDRKSGGEGEPDAAPDSSPDPADA